MVNPPTSPSGSRPWLEMLLLAAAYYVTGRLGLLLAIPPGFATAVWPPSGIALAVLLARGNRLWPGVLAGSFALNLGISLDPGPTGSIAESLVVAAGIGLGASLQAAVGSGLLGRFVSMPLELVKDRDILKFLLVGGPASCALNATSSVTLLALAGSITWSQYPFTWWTWWTGDAIGAIVVAPMVLAWIGAPRVVWTRRRVTVALPLLLMFGAVVFLFARASSWERARIKLGFDAQSAAIASSAGRKLKEAIGFLYAVEALYASVRTVDAETFRRFVDHPLARHRGIQAISWNPLVLAPDRSDFERAVRREGLREFQVVEQSTGDRLIPAGSRAEHVPVLFIEPRRGNERALGYDVASDPVRLAALVKARDSGIPTATRRLILVQESGGESGVLVFLPVYRLGAPTRSVEERRRGLEGYVTGVFRLRDLMTESLAGVDRRGIALRLLDLDSAEADGLLWQDAPGPFRRGPQRGLPELVAEHPLTVAGCAWSLTLEGGPDYLVQSRSQGPWTVLAGGLLFTGLLGAFLLSVTGRAILNERIGAERSLELSQINVNLEREILDRKAAEASLSRKEGELLQAQKMEAIGRLAGGVAHDFNNLLTAILGYSELLLSRLGPEFPFRADLEEIRKASERAAQLTAQLLAFGRKQVLKPTVLDLNLVVSDMDKMLRRVIGEDIELVTTLRPDAGRVRADRGQVEQVLLNLALNARDAMPRGGKLSLETRGVEVDTAQVDARGLPPAGLYVALILSDNGVGMDEATMAHLFEPFFTTKERGKGTGLGLSTVYGIITQSGGHIRVRSRLGEGTAFTLYLPRVDALPSDSRLKPVPDAKADGSGTVLLVEDEEVVRRLSAAVLRQHGYAVLEAGNGMEALQLLERDGRRIDVLVTDMIMPKMGGRELVQTLITSRPDTKVLYISGYAETAILHQGVLGPNSSFLAKPFTPLALAREVRLLLESGEEGNSSGA